MEFKIDLIVKIGLVVLFVVMFAKIGASYLTHFLDRFTGGSHKPHDIDAMIEAKKHMIRTGEYGGFYQEPPPLPPGVVGPKPEERLKSQLKDPSIEEGQKVELKKILTLFEESTWGGGASFDRMKKNFEAQMSVSLESSLFMRAFRLANSRHLIHNQRSYLQVENLCLNSAFLIKIMNECLERQGPLLARLASQGQIAPFHILRAAELIFLKQSKQAEVHLYAYLLQTKAESASELSRFAQDEKDRILEKLLSQNNLGPRELAKKIIEEAQIFASLAPMPNLQSNKDVKGAYALLGMNEKNSEEEIKKHYRQLALERHPDRLSGKNIPPKYQEISKQNFTLIKQALDIVLAERKRNA